MNIGIDIGGSHIAVGLVQDSVIIIKKEHNWTEQEKNNFFESVEKYSKNLIEEIIIENVDTKIGKIGIGFPAANITDGKVTKFGQTIDLTKILSEYFNIPTFLKNDVKCSALCEKKYGSLKNYKNCLFMTLGTGIGGAYFYNGKLLRPNKFQGFEIGHMIIKKDGKQCNCGNKGCFEQYASMRIFRNKLEELFDIKNINSYKFFELLNLKEKEEKVKEIIEEYIDYLEVGIINLINIFEPDAISIGGSFTYYAPVFIDKLKQRLQSKFLNRTIPDIIIASFENDAGIIGASMLEEN